MEICNKKNYQHQDFQEQKRNEMKKPTQEVFAHGDKAKYDRKQSQALNTILLRARAPIQKSSNIEDTECRRHKAASMSNNRILFRNGDPPTRPREEPDLKYFSHRLDSNKVELNLNQHPPKKGRVKLQVLRSFSSKEDGDHDAGDAYFAEGLKMQGRNCKGSHSTKSSCSGSTTTSTNSSTTRLPHEYLVSPRKSLEAVAEILVEKDPANGISPSPPTCQFSSSPFNAPHRRISGNSPRKLVIENFPNRLSDCREKDDCFSLQLHGDDRCINNIGDCEENESTSVHEFDQECVVVESSSHFRRRTSFTVSPGGNMHHADSKFPVPNFRGPRSPQLRIDVHSPVMDEPGSAQKKSQHVWSPGGRQEGVEADNILPNSNAFLSAVKGALHGPVRRRSFKEPESSGPESDPRRVQFCHTDTWEYLDEHSSMDLDVLLIDEDSCTSEGSIRDLNDVDGLSRMLSWRSIVESPAEYVAENCLDRNIWPERYKSFPFGISTPVPLSLGGSCDVDEEDDEAFRSYEKSLQRDDVLLRKQLEIKLVRATR